jgi:2-polyprenyl-6-hydroxyphenyl methylase/3-demethylubiquinone-9 3-methyltransferase
MNIQFDTIDLTDAERERMKDIIAQQRDGLTDLEQIWYLMDLAWNECGCDNKKLDFDKVAQFYSHPVWLLNGLFIEQDDISMGHREAISDWVVQNRCKKIIDYGGGFGTLAKMIARKDHNSNVYIYEPHPSEYCLRRLKKYENIEFIGTISEQYDCVVSTDVLEHVPDPLKDFADMIAHVHVGGYLIVANCFYPVIKCHLPQNFHFRYTFKFFAKIMGVEVMGNLSGTHAIIFKKNRETKTNWIVVRICEKISRFAFPFLHVAESMAHRIKRSFIKK